MSRFLQERCGVRWWTLWASRIPKQETLRLGELNIREEPAFEYRESFWYPAFNADWSWRNGCNGHSSRLTSDKGGLMSYEGFVHTFFPLVPPEKHSPTNTRSSRRRRSSRGPTSSFGCAALSATSANRSLIRRTPPPRPSCRALRVACALERPAPRVRGRRGRVAVTRLAQSGSGRMDRGGSRCPGQTVDQGDSTQQRGPDAGEVGGSISVGGAEARLPHQVLHRTKCNSEKSSHVLFGPIGRIPIEGLLRLFLIV